MMNEATAPPIRTTRLQKVAESSARCFVMLLTVQGNSVDLTDVVFDDGARPLETGGSLSNPV
jgi:hypothetical protein